MKILVFFLTILFPFCNLSADCESTCSCEEEPVYCSDCSQPTFLENLPILYNKPWTLVVRLAYYSPKSKEVRDIYSSSWLDYQVEASRRIFNYVDFWVGVSWAVKKHGKVGALRYGFKDTTRLLILPLSTGFRWIYPILPCTEIYLGAGVCYSFLENRNRFNTDSSYCDYTFRYCSAPYKKCVHKSGVGGLFKLGINYTMSTSTFLDIFVDYYLQSFTLSKTKYSKKMNVLRDRHVDCSGFKIGAGLGVYF